MYHFILCIGTKICKDKLKTKQNRDPLPCKVPGLSGPGLRYSQLVIGTDRPTDIRRVKGSPSRLPIGFIELTGSGGQRTSLAAILTR